MARGKKKEALTPEERLQAALVPDCEQPYKVPKNWCWTYIKLGFDVTSSKRVHKKDWLTNGIPFYRTRELVKLSENGYVNNELFISEELYNSFVDEYGIPQTGDLLISGVGTIGIPYVIKEKQKFYFKDGNIIWFKNRGIFNSEYVYFLYKSAFVSEQIHQMSSGTTVDTYTIVNANSTIVPLPPLPEQQRIVDRIESLFAKLDEAKQKAQDALDSFETRKAAILHKAFTGELTTQWRKEHGVEMESWDKTILKNVCKVNPKKTDTNGLPDDLEVSFFPMASLSEIYGEITEPQTRLLKDVKNGFTNFSEGDVVFAKITPCMENGKSAIIGKLVNGIGYGTTEFYVLRCNENLYNRYLYHMVRDTSFRNKAKAVMSGAVGQQRVPKSFMENYPINLPSVPEQTEIVRILDCLLAKEQQAKDAAEAVLEQIDLIKKSILARAFRGKLGTNDPSEESAVELVKEII